MDRGKALAGLAIMVGLMFLGAMLPQAVKQFRSYERTVNVKGLCEKEVPADKVIWPLAFKVVGDNLEPLNAEIDRKTAEIKKFLTDGGINPSEITVSLPSISDKFTQEYGSNDRRYRYVAKEIVTVCTKDVDKVLALMASQNKLLRAGITLEDDWESRPEFSFEGLNDVKPEMIEEATKNAREVALKFAKDSDSRLGKIKQATQGTFSISDRDSNTPQIKNVRVVTNVTYYLTR
ncbi:MAG: SIMPL domain-containing protein [Bacteroidales bacterium]|nr:SIMPL domain-containing protein [Bacteroidales bacterium]